MAEIKEAGTASRPNGKSWALPGHFMRLSAHAHRNLDRADIDLDHKRI